MPKTETRSITERFYYGWIVVGVTFLSSMVSSGLSGYGLAFFIVPMSSALNVSRGAFSSITLFRLTSIPLIPFLGALVDKPQGARLMMTLGSIVAGITLILTATVTNIWQFYLFYGLMFGLATTLMGGMVIEPALIAKWFVRRRGRAMAIAMMGISAGGVVIAPWAGWLVDTMGWRIAWVALGVTIFLLLTLPALTFIRRSPEDIGLRPDGGLWGEDPSNIYTGVDTPNNTSSSEYPWTLREATKTKALWLLLCVHMFGGLAWRPIIIHQVAYIQDKGFDLSTATSVATTIAFFSMIAQLPWGYWTEKYSLKFLISSCGITSGLSVLILVITDSLWGLYMYAVVHGLTQGGFPTLMNVAWASFFGREHSGAIRGAVFPPVVVMGFLSPAIAGWMWDKSESYALAFICFAISWMISGLIMLGIKRPKPGINLPI